MYSSLSTFEKKSSDDYKDKLVLQISVRIHISAHQRQTKLGLLTYDNLLEDLSKYGFPLQSNTSITKS